MTPNLDMHTQRAFRSSTIFVGEGEGEQILQAEFWQIDQ